MSLLDTLLKTRLLFLSRSSARPRVTDRLPSEGFAWGLKQWLFIDVGTYWNFGWNWTQGTETLLANSTCTPSNTTFIIKQILFTSTPETHVSTESCNRYIYIYIYSLEIKRSWTSSLPVHTPQSYFLKSHTNNILPPENWLLVTILMYRSFTPRPTLRSTRLRTWKFRPNVTMQWLI